MSDFFQFLGDLGFWLAVPLAGFWIFKFNKALHNCAFPWLTRLAVITSAGIVAWSVFLLFFAVFGVFRDIFFQISAWLVISPSLVYFFKRVRKVHMALPKPGIWDILLWMGLCMAAWLYLGYPTESIHGGRDQGGYANHAIYIANHGRLDIPYPWQDEDKETRAVLDQFYFRDCAGNHGPDAHGSYLVLNWIAKAIKTFRFHTPKQDCDYTYFPGLYKTDLSLTVQFADLLPTWLARAFSTFGHHGLFRLNGIFSLLFLFIFYGLCRLLLPVPFAVFAVLVMALNPAQIWISRITLSEVLAQLLIASGLLLLSMSLRNKNRSMARWAGIFLGFSALVRIDCLFLAALLLISHAVHTLLEDRFEEKILEPWLSFHACALPLFAFSAGYYALFNTHYFIDLSYAISRTALAALACLLGLLVSHLKMVKKIGPTLSKRAVLAVIGLAWFGLGIYAYWIRPELFGPLTKETAYMKENLPLLKVFSLVNLAAYLSPLIVWAGLVGGFWALYRMLRTKKEYFHLAVLVVVVGYSFLYLHHPLISPDHIWAIRRFVPVIIPGFVLFAAFGLWRISCKLPKPYFYFPALAAMVYMSIFLYQASEPIRTFAEDEGQYFQIKQLHDKLPRDAFIVANIFEYDAMSWTTPLFMAFDHGLLPVDLDSEAGQEFFEKWQRLRSERNRPVYIVQHKMPSLSEVKILDRSVLTRSRLEQTVMPLARKILHEKKEIFLLEVLPSYRPPKQYMGIVLGARPVWKVQEHGFWSQEYDQHRPFRWTRKNSYLKVPVDRNDEPRFLKILVNTPWPDGTRFKIAVNGQELMNEVIGPGMFSHLLSLQGCRMENKAKIELFSDTFQPKNVFQNSTDSRRLGVAVYEIRLLDTDRPMSGQPLSKDGYASRWIRMDTEEKISLEQASKKCLEFSVENIGTEPWPVPDELGKIDGSVQVGILWFARGHTDKPLAEHRASLPYTFYPGDHAPITICINPVDNMGKPLSIGDYEVHISLVQESVHWFYEMGDDVSKIFVTVTEN